MQEDQASEEEEDFEHIIGGESEEAKRAALLQAEALSQYQPVIINHEPPAFDVNRQKLENDEEFQVVSYNKKAGGKPSKK